MANLLLLIAGFVVGVFFFVLAYMPLLYGFPKSAYWAFKGVIRWRAVGNFAIAAISWQAIAVLVFLALLKFRPSVLLFIADHSGWAWGSWIGFAVGFLNMFSNQAKLDFAQVVEGFVDRNHPLEPVYRLRNPAAQFALDQVSAQSKSAAGS